MQITLDQIKQIAQAAYHIDLPEVDGTFELLEHDSSGRYCRYLVFNSEEYPKEAISIFSIIVSKGRIYTGDGRLSWLYKPLRSTVMLLDHLSAIRKMEELGLIEK